MKIKLIRLTKTSEVKYLDLAWNIVDLADATPWPEAEALEIIGYIRNRGRYRGYHIDTVEA